MTAGREQDAREGLRAEVERLRDGMWEVYEAGYRSAVADARRSASPPATTGAGRWRPCPGCGMTWADCYDVGCCDACDHRAASPPATDGDTAGGGVVNGIRVCGVGTGGGEICWLPVGHVEPHDPDAPDPFPVGDTETRTP